MQCPYRLGSLFLCSPLRSEIAGVGECFRIFSEDDWELKVVVILFPRLF